MRFVALLVVALILSGCVWTGLQEADNPNNWPGKWSTRKNPEPPMEIGRRFPVEGKD